MTRAKEMSANKNSSAAKTRRYRERMRAQGLRPIQLWAPDVRDARFRAEAHRESKAIAASAQEKDDQDFIDAISDWE